MDEEFDEERYKRIYNKAFALFHKYEHCFIKNRSKYDAYELLDHDEIGSGISIICIVLIKNNIAVTQEEYDFNKYLRGDLADDDGDDDFCFKLTDLQVLKE